MPPAILYYAIPGFLILLALEAWLSYKENKQLFEIKDTWSSLGLGIGNVIIGFATKAIIFGLSATTWWYWIFLFLADDLSYYFFHRTAHNVNWFWASHVVHHSSRKYN